MNAYTNGFIEKIANEHDKKKKGGGLAGATLGGLTGAAAGAGLMSNILSKKRPMSLFGGDTGDIDLQDLLAEYFNVAPGNVMAAGTGLGTVLGGLAGGTLGYQGEGLARSLYGG